MALFIFAGVLLNSVIATTGVSWSFDNPLEWMETNSLNSREKRGRSKPFCSEVVEHPFANCVKMRSSGKCDPSSILMKRWCARTCKLCTEDRAAAHVPCEITRYGCCADKIRPAKGKNGLGCPENCQDNPAYKRVCQSYAKNGYCATYYNTLKRLCPRSCKMCDKKIVDGCYNQLDDSKCKRYSQYGFCKSPKLKMRMSKLCGLTCEACTKLAPKLSTIVPKCVTEGCCWDHKTPLNKGCPPCKDSFPFTLCPRFKQECFQVDRLQSVQIRIFCPKTCGICKRSAHCEDDITYGLFCKEWKRDGECQKNKGAMRLYCKKTCNLC